MRSKLIIFFTLALTLLIGSREMTMPFDLVETSTTERSEEVPSRESEEHASVISSRVIRPLVSGTGSNIVHNFFSDSGFRKLVARHSDFFKSSLHILFLSLRH